MVLEHNQRVWFVLDLSIQDRRAQRVATFTSRDEAEADVQSRIGGYEIRPAIYKRHKPLAGT